MGVPLIARTVKAAAASTLVNNVAVTSDDPEILAIAQEYGAEAVLRPQSLAQDTSSSESALLHAIEASAACRTADVIVFLQCTSPFTTPEEIDLVVGALGSQCADVAFAVVEAHVFLWEIGADGAGVGVNHDASRPRQRRQDRPLQYRETGAIYAMRKDGFVSAGSRFFGRAVPVALPGGADIDLDTPEDWALAEAYAAERAKE